MSQFNSDNPYAIRYATPKSEYREPVYWSQKILPDNTPIIKQDGTPFRGMIPQRPIKWELPSDLIFENVPGITDYTHPAPFPVQNPLFDLKILAKTPEEAQGLASNYWSANIMGITPEALAKRMYYAQRQGQT